MRWMTGLLLAGLGGCSDGGPPAAPQADPAQVVTVQIGDERGAVAESRAGSTAPQHPPGQQIEPLHAEPPQLEVVMDVMQVVGRSEAEVAAVLGAPLSCAEIHRARLCRYGRHQDEVMFARGKADMITVQGMDAVSFSADALRALGLPPAKPDHSDEHAIRWDSIPALEEVAVFPGPGQAVDFAYVKVGAH